MTLPLLVADSHLTTVGATHQGTDVDLLSSALHHAHRHERQDSASKKDDNPTNIEIVVDKDVLVIRGTGIDEVTPALLSGQVALNLAESTPVKQITLQFRGKVKQPPVEHERPGFSNTATYIICNHEWSFLEGEKKHSHTLKAGRHLFPFQLNLGGSLPSTLSIGAHGGVSIAYKLRAIATRPGFALNLQTQKAITVLRSLVRESLEYQQSLEIENTWPEKVMYSIMVPHKAWAAGDDLTAVVKFSPLAKGVRVLSVVTTLNETTKISSRSGSQESTKPVITAKHVFRNGQALWVEHQDHRSRSGSTHQPGTRSSHPFSASFTPACSTDPQHPSPASNHGMVFLPTWGPSPLSDPAGPPSPEDGPSSSQSPHPNAEPGSESHAVPIDFEMSEEDIATKLEISLPLCTTPTHALQPIITSHRIRWSILISNLDGHTSELRCSLPLHILDYRLLDEAKSATAETRRLLLGGPEVSEEHNPDLELPSYPSHIRDRIANMYLPDQAVLRVTNRWISLGISPVQLDSDQDGRQSNFTSGTHTPLEAQHASPPPTGHDASDLEYVNSELLLSLSEHVTVPPPIETHRDTASPPGSTPPSRRASLAPSRAPSPDRERESSSHQLHSRRSSSGSGAGTGGTYRDAPTPDTTGPPTYLHTNNAANRNLHGLFHTTMKPLTSLTSSFALPSRHFAPTPLSPVLSSSSPHNTHTARDPRQSHGYPGTTMTTTTGSLASSTTLSLLPRSVPATSHSLLHRSFTEVPDYGIASRGFLGGVTPLETLQGLPSYEEAEMQRSRSESDLASMMAARQGGPLRPARSAASPGTP